ncbi:MAG TPA: hypothetical protein VGT98_00080, partial [Candidatus Elarobacter sp.]|nr:hypothetical protein [Candidatus Elarobacter sp.]
MRRSLAARGLPVVTWGLTFHILIIAILFGLLRLPTPVVQGVAAWKEAIGVLLLVTVIVRAATGLGPRVCVSMADLFAGGWIALALIMLATENVVWDHAISAKGA